MIGPTRPRWPCYAIFKAFIRHTLGGFIPYLVVVFLPAAFSILEMHSTQYTGAALAVTAKDSVLNLAVQIVAIIAMRSIGLFYRYYSCLLPW